MGHVASSTVGVWGVGVRRADEMADHHGRRSLEWQLCKATGAAGCSSGCGCDVCADVEWTGHAADVQASGLVSVKPS
jgi:hypothetical protein